MQVKLPNSADSNSPFVVPDFRDPKPPMNPQFIWWSWHPLYPEWTQTCWKFDTKEAALDFVASDVYSLSLYHNKLIHHTIDGLEEVYDLPCEKVDIWIKILDNMTKGFYNDSGRPTAEPNPNFKI